MATKKDPHLDSAGRLHDGYAYIVVRNDGANERFHDEDQLPAIITRWEAARTTDGLLSFTGAREASEQDNDDGKTTIVVQKIEGMGAILASSIVGIRYASPRDAHHEEALESVRVFHDLQTQIQAEVAQDLMPQPEEPDPAEEEQLADGFKTS